MPASRDNDAERRRALQVAKHLIRCCLYVLMLSYFFRANVKAFYRVESEKAASVVGKAMLASLPTLLLITHFAPALLASGGVVPSRRIYWRYGFVGTPCQSPR